MLQTPAYHNRISIKESVSERIWPRNAYVMVGQPQANVQGALSEQNYQICLESLKARGVLHRESLEESNRVDQDAGNSTYLQKVK